MEGKFSTPATLYAGRLAELFLTWWSAADVPEHVKAIWTVARAAVLLPAMKVTVVACLVMSVILVYEKLSMALVVLYVRLFRRTPEKLYKWEAMAEDAELGPLAYPMVLVQIPMFNEREVYQMSIRAVCTLQWPSDRLIIQVLDDSTDGTIRELVQEECDMWSKMGMNINYISRDNRNGYKAGALREAIDIEYVKECDYVAIFDADHEPPPDFLKRTIPFLVHNHDLALVQARWKFVNAHECIMTRIQEMSLNYHFKIEQQSGSSTLAYFGFNGTAGVWRIAALGEAGGWKDRTTVEDMDLAVRATLQGWKFVYLNDLMVKSELPSSYTAYRFQQHRWACGPANLFKKMAIDIAIAKKVSIKKKIFLLYNFFFARRIVAYNVTFLFYSVVIPLSSFFPEITIPKWGVFYIPTLITVLNAISTPRSLHLIVIWIFFENVMSLHRFKAVYIGLFEAKRANEWVVTEKSGNLLKTKQTDKVTKNRRNKIWQRIHFLELGMGLFLMICAAYSFLFKTSHYFIFIFPQSISFLIMGFGLVGTYSSVAK